MLAHNQLINLGEQQRLFCDVIGQNSEVLLSGTHGCATKIIILCKMNDLHIQGLIDFYEESNAEKSKLRLKTIENNFCELQMKKIICTSYKMCFGLTFFTFKYLPL